MTSERVSVYQAMGRRSGFITAAARLADPQRQLPLQLYFAESGHNLATLAENVSRELGRSGRCIVVINEGFDVGEIGAARDAFGHVEYGASQLTAVQAVVNFLNSQRLPARGQATGQQPGILQRSTFAYRSVVDLSEAYAVGAHAVTVALTAGTGYMATIHRAPGPGYRVSYGQVELTAVANSERFLPAAWLSSDGLDVTDDFLRYAAPLIGDRWPELPLENGLPRFARLRRDFVAKKCPIYTPVNMR
jgi:ATP-dependent phosphofructokinase / diphosphate-dependent phosphofructokinase